MAHQTIKLNPKQCAALLEAIVDCDPTLYKLISDCSKEYTENPERYEQEEEMFELFYDKWVKRYDCSFESIEYLTDGNVQLYYYDLKQEETFSCVYNIKTKTFTKA